jgi:hypothetical protein
MSVGKTPERFFMWGGLQPYSNIRLDGEACENKHPNLVGPFISYENEVFW